MADNAWQWQEKGTPWKGVGIYHVTLVVPNLSRVEVFLMPLPCGGC